MHGSFKNDLVFFCLFVYLLALITLLFDNFYLYVHILVPLNTHFLIFFSYTKPFVLPKSPPPTHTLSHFLPCFIFFFWPTALNQACPHGVGVRQSTRAWLSHLGTHHWGQWHPFLDLWAPPSLMAECWRPGLGQVISAVTPWVQQPWQPSFQLFFLFFLHVATCSLYFLHNPLLCMQGLLSLRVRLFPVLSPLVTWLRFDRNGISTDRHNYKALEPRLSWN